MNALFHIGDVVDVVEPVTPSVPSVPQRWFLIRVMPNRELSIQDRLLARGICAYVPRETWSRSSATRRPVVKPIFDGMIFVPDFDADLRRLRAYSDGLIGFVRFGDRAACAGKRVMDAIHRIEARLNLPLGQRKFASGQHVRVVTGPFGYFEGTIERLDSKGRLKVLLRVFEREVSVAVDETQIEPV